MKILLVGGAGFIGSYIAKELLKQGDEITIHDAFLNYIHPLNSNYESLLKLRLNDIINDITLIRGDIRHKGRFLKILKENKPDAVILLAALPIATASNIYSEDAFGINLNGTVNVLESIREVPSIKRFIYASSSMVYGNFQYSPADENHPTNPIEVYGGTKLAGEILTKAFGKRFNIPYTIIRPSAVYGPTDVNRRVSQIFIENALKNKPLILEDGGNSKLDFSYVEDVAHGFILALKSDKAMNETFNITNGNSRSIKEFAQILQKHIPNIKIEEKPSKELRPKRGTLSIEKAKKLLNFNPKYNIEDGIPKYIDFFKENNLI